MFAPFSIAGQPSGHLAGAGFVSSQAVRLFEHAVHVARRKRLVARLHGRLRRLEQFDNARAELQLTGRHDEGVRTVPLDCIQGSLDGAGGFDSEFYPLDYRAEKRWVQVATAILQGKALPPVQLIALGDRYFVVDGHHRISVARILKNTHIDAEVIVWEVNGQGEGGGCSLRR